MKHGFKTKQQIANEKGIHLHTLQRRLSKIGMIIPRGLISPEIQKEIDQALGWSNDNETNTKRDEKG